MSIGEYIEELKTLIKILIDDVQNINNEIKEVRNDINILKIEVRKIKENNKGKEKTIDKKLIEKEMSRIGKKYTEQENIRIEAGSMDDEFRKRILPKIIEEEEKMEKSKEKAIGKLEIKENQDNIEEDE